MNSFRTGLLLAALTSLFLTIGYLIGGQNGIFIALAFSLATNAFAYWNGNKLVLSMHGAREVSAADAPEFYNMVKDLAANANLPMPRVYIMENAQPNAFATGRNPENAAVAATTGLLNMLTRDEIAGVMAHELAHVKNRDTLIMTLTATLAGAISMLANFAFFFGGNRREGGIGPIATIAMMILAPMAAMLVQMAISRTREYGADRMGAEICGNPQSLASALAKISGAAHRIVNNQAEANPATAHMFIINPLSGARMDNLFSTHPDTQNRIKALMALEPGTASAPAASGPVPSGPWNRARTKRGPWG